MGRELHNTVVVRKAISPQRSTGDTPIVSSIIDRANFEGVTFAIAIGTLADAGATWAVTLEEGDDSALSDAAAVSQADLIGTLALAGFNQGDDDECRKVSYKGRRRYLRLTLTSTGNAGNADVSVVALLVYPRYVPQGTQAT